MLLHIADIHLGATLNGFDLLEDQKYVLNNILTIIKDKKIKYLVLAGDIFDKYNPSNEAITLFEDFITKVSKLNVRTIIISGNHDSKARLNYLSKFLNSYNIYIYTSIIEMSNILEFEDDKLSFLPIPYLNKKELELYYNESKLSNIELHQKLINDYFLNAKKDYKHIAICHNLVKGSNTSDSERTLSIGGLDDLSKDLFKDFNYTALGHLHLYQQIDNIYYPGSICKYSISEFNNVSSAILYDYNTNAITRLELVQLHNSRVIKGEFNTILENAKNDALNDDYISVSLLDQTIVYDAFNRLSAYYPNIVSLTYNNLENKNQELNKHIEIKKLDEYSLIKDFYEQMYSSTLSLEQETYLKDIITKVKEEI